MRRKRRREKGEKMKGKGREDINEWLNNQSVSQVNTTITKKYNYKITANPKSFQVDLLWWKRGETLTPILLFVDILSRKLWAFVLSKNKDTTRGENILECIEKIHKEIGGIKNLNAPLRNIQDFAQMLKPRQSRRWIPRATFV